MEIAKLEQANALVSKIREIDAEIKAWSETTAPHHLGMQQHWNDNHLVPMPCKHSPRSAFDAYRDSCINALKVKRGEIEKEIEAI